MARTARVKDTYGIYYVTQSSSGCQPLFQNNADRQYFIDILQSTVNTFNCKILDYCAQADSTYHLIIDVNGGDLSKIMKSINIPYAMHIACEGKLFKDRYKSRPIIDGEDLTKVRATIKEATFSGGGYSSFCVSEITPCDEVALTDCTHCLSCNEEASQWLHASLNALDIDISDLKKNKDLRNRLIKELRRNSTLSLKAIGQVFGGLSESSVSKILKS